MLKLSNNKLLGISSNTIMQTHINTISTLGKVTYTCSLAIVNNNPNYIILNIANDDTKCYVCKVEKKEYNKEPFVSKEQDMIKYCPNEYKNVPEKTWLLLTSIQEIDVDFLCSLVDNEEIRNSIKNRSNNKILKKITYSTSEEKIY